MSKSDIQAKMMAAKELIQSGNLREAKHILQQVDNSTARQWEAKIDARLAQIAPTKSKKGTYIKLAIIVIGIIIVVMFFVLDNKRASDNMDKFKAQQASDQQVSDMQSCLLQYPNSTLLYNACMKSLGH